MQALLDYLKADLDIGAYWARLTAEGVSKERLASYDRPIVSEPNLKPEQKEGLIRDLGAYLKTLKAVHSGADLESAAAAVLGYKLDAMRVSRLARTRAAPTQMGPRSLRARVSALCFSTQKACGPFAGPRHTLPPAWAAGCIVR